MAKEFNRTQRLAGQIQRELAQIIQREIRDPRIGLVTISDVKVSRDLAHAQIYVTVMESSQDIETVLSLLKKAGGFLRHALGQRLVVRMVPELHFHYDSSLDRGMRVAALIDSVTGNRDKDKEME